MASTIIYNRTENDRENITTTSTYAHYEDGYSITNETLPSSMPSDLTVISVLNKSCIIVYALLFILSAVSNISTLTQVAQRVKLGKGRTDLLFMHLCIADLSVAFLLMPVEIFWRVTIAWRGGDILCRICQFARAFGLYLSSNLVVCISIDRYYAIVYPLKFVGARRRVKWMLFAAWIVSTIFASPQLFIYQVVSHPVYPDFQQCVTRAFIATDLYNELIYNVSSVSALYFIPLLVIIYTNTRILWKIHKKSQEHEAARQKETTESDNISQSHQIHAEATSSRSRGFFQQLEVINCNWRVKRYVDPSANACNLPVLRSSANQTATLSRARSRTLRLTLLILVTFIACWTPYSIMTLWYMVDRKGASQVDERVQEALFLMAVTNSVLNPLIYSSFRRKGN